MAIICRDYNLLFIMTPRTACTALGTLLRNDFGGEFLPAEDIVDSKGFFVVQQKHCTLQELIEHKLLSEEEASIFHKFTFVRNPYDSLYSLYVKKRSKYQPLLKDPDSWVNRVPNYVKDMSYCKDHSFDEWIRKKFLRSIIKRLLGRKTSMYDLFTAGLDEVMHFEDIQNNFQEMLTKLNIPVKSSIPVLNTTSGRQVNYRKYYTSISRKIVQYKYKDDLAKYGYTF